MKYIIILLTLFLFFSCQKDNEGNPLDPTTLPIVETNEGGDITVDYSTYEGTWDGINTYTAISNTSTMYCLGYTLSITEIELEGNEFTWVIEGTYSIFDYVAHSDMFIDAKIDIVITNCVAYTNGVIYSNGTELIGQTSLAIARLSNEVLYFAFNEPGESFRPIHYDYNYSNTTNLLLINCYRFDVFTQ